MPSRQEQEKTSHPGPSEGNDAALVRLARLEREIIALRHELADDSSVAPSLPPGGFHVLVFSLGDDVYGIPISRVREIIRFARLTRVSGASRAIAGVLDVHGEMIPIMDLRARLGLEPRRPTLSTPIILVHAGNVALGLSVDAARDVAAIERAQVEPAGRALRMARALAGMTRCGDALVQILDTGLLLSTLESDELGQIVGVAQDDESGQTTAELARSPSELEADPPGPGGS